MRQQNPPNAVQLELVEGCNLRCDFCGLQGIRKEGAPGYKFLDPRTAGRLGDEMARLRWSSRIELAMHGEPTMHPNAAEVVSILRGHLPRNQIMMTSNGGGLLKSPGPVANLGALFDAGLNVFALDCYEYVNIAPKVREAVKFTPRDFMVKEYPADNTASPHTRHPPGTRLLVYVQDISVAAKGTHSHLNNHAGSAAPPSTAGHGKKCAKPFRELSVRWDGNIAVCCNDWRGVYKVGNILKKPLDQIWNSGAFESARRFLYAGNRAALEPCAGCDALSYRVGLLPDPLGKETMPAPTPVDQEMVDRCTAGAPYTAPVRREWENVVKLRRKA